MQHAGHRKRLKDRFLKYGLDSFEDHNIFELLLFFSIPRSDTNLTGHNLMDKFGTFDKVFDADFDELISVNGIGESSAAFIKFVKAIGDRYVESRTENAMFINSSDDAVEYIKDVFSQSDCPILAVSIDGKCALIRSHEIYPDPDDGESIKKKIVRAGLFDNAMSMIIAARYENPDPEKFKPCAQKIHEALSSVGITLADVLLFASEGAAAAEGQNCISDK